MDSRDMLIIGAVAVAAFLYFRAHQTSQGPVNQVVDPAAVPGATPSAQTLQAQGYTYDANGQLRKPADGIVSVSQIGRALGSPFTSFNGFSALEMGTQRFVGSAVTAVVTDAISPTPVRRAPVMSTPTIVGGAGVYPVGAGSMGPQPGLTTVINPLQLKRY